MTDERTPPSTPDNPHGKAPADPPGDSPLDFGDFPREAQPPAWIEESLVVQLRDEGRIGDHPARRPRRRPAWTAWMPAAAAVAGLGLFATGFLVGERRGTDRTLEAFEVASGATTAYVEAARAQRLGSLYVESLARLAATEGSDDPAVDQGMESARTILWAAALELARLDPDDAALARVLTELSGGDPPSGDARTQYWF